MDRVAWKIKLKIGMKEEYKRRHDDIWPEMTEILNHAGVHNYTIWNIDNDLFGYYEVEDKDVCNAILKESAVVNRWNEYMKDVIEFELDPVTGTVKAIEKMFYHV